jgi:nucleoside-diphosphate-sugar epimerase
VAEAPAFVTGGSGFVGQALIRRLVAGGREVHALARSDSAAAKVAAAGATPFRGDLDDVAAMQAGAERCAVTFHSAAALGDWGDREEFERVNVQGTRNVLQASAQAGVRRFVHVGTEAALMAGEPLENINEDAPLRRDSKVLYSSTKAGAEQAVRDANREGFETVVVRPRFIWGHGDTTLLPRMVEMVEAGRFAWIGGGRQRTATTHVGNTVEGLILAAERGRPGGVYFVTDGPPVVFREFVSALLETQGVAVPTRTVPAPVAGAIAALSEGLWRLTRRKSAPPLTRFTVWASSQECTLDDSRARDEMGYRPVVTRDEGLAELAAARAEAA